MATSQKNLRLTPDVKGSFESFAETIDGSESDALAKLLDIQREHALTSGEESEGTREMKGLLQRALALYSAKETLTAEAERRLSEVVAAHPEELAALRKELTAESEQDKAKIKELTGELATEKEKREAAEREREQAAQTSRATQDHNNRLQSDVERLTGEAEGFPETRARAEELAEKVARLEREGEEAQARAALDKEKAVFESQREAEAAATEQRRADLAKIEALLSRIGDMEKAHAAELAGLRKELADTRHDTEHDTPAKPAPTKPSAKKTPARKPKAAE